MNNSWLSNLEFDDKIENVTSARNDDVIIDKIMKVIGTKNKCCVEFGASDGKTCSNTWNLINNHGWQSVQIEGDPIRYGKLRDRYKTKQNVTCLNTLVDYKGDNTIDLILKQNNFPQDLDLISIDIDGYDYYVWDSMEWLKPRCIVIEYNKTIPSVISFVPTENYQGCSLLALVELGKKKGYELVAANDLNGFFVLKDDFPLFGISDNSIQSVFPDHDKYVTHLFQTFDGKIHVAGHSKLTKDGQHKTLDRLLWGKGLKDKSISGQFRNNNVEFYVYK